MSITNCMINNIIKRFLKKLINYLFKCFFDMILTSVFLTFCTFLHFLNLFWMLENKSRFFITIFNTPFLGNAIKKNKKKIS